MNKHVQWYPTYPVRSLAATESSSGSGGQGLVEINRHRSQLSALHCTPAHRWTHPKQLQPPSTWMWQLGHREHGPQCMQFHSARASGFSTSLTSTQGSPQLQQQWSTSHMLKALLSMGLNKQCTSATNCPVLDARKQGGQNKWTQSLGTLSRVPVMLANASDSTITSSTRAVVKEVIQWPEGKKRRTVQLPGTNGQRQETDINALRIEHLSL